MSDATATSTQGLANANAQALVTASGGKITWAQLVTLVAISGQQTGGSYAAIPQDGTTDSEDGATGSLPGGGTTNVGWGPWQTTPWTTADGALTLENAALSAWAKFQTQGFGAWNLGPTGTTQLQANGTLPNGTSVPISSVPSALQFQQSISAANTVMQPPKNYSTPANAAVVAAAGGPNTLNPDTVIDPNIQDNAVAPPPASTATGSIFGNCNSNISYLSYPSQDIKVTTLGGGSIINQCNVKAYLSALMIGWGVVLGCIGMLLLFDRSGKLLGKVGGKAAELAGAATAAVPGGEAVGSAVMAAGHHVSKAAGSKAPAKQTPRQKSTATKQAASQSASQSSSAPASQPSSSSRPRQHSSSSSTSYRPGGSAPAPRPRQTSTPSQSQVNNMSSAQKRSLLQQHAKSGGAVSAA